MSWADVCLGLIALCALTSCLILADLWRMHAQDRLDAAEESTATRHLYASRTAAMGADALDEIAGGAR